MGENMVSMCENRRGGGTWGQCLRMNWGGGGGGEDRHNHTNLKRHSTRIFTMLKPGVAGKFLNRPDR